MKVKEVMKTGALKSCSPETNIRNAARVMKTANCGALPVIDKSKKVVGIITDRDICLSLARNYQPTTVVSKIMTKTVSTVRAADDLTIALRQMREKRVGRLPVVDKEGKLEGIVSLHDLLDKGAQTDLIAVGKEATPEENIIKTVQAITSRYNHNGKAKAQTTRKTTKVTSV